jgi:hypothetical protein
MPPFLKGKQFRIVPVFDLFGIHAGLFQHRKKPFPGGPDRFRRIIAGEDFQFQEPAQIFFRRNGGFRAAPFSPDFAEFQGNAPGVPSPALCGFYDLLL